MVTFTVLLTAVVLLSPSVPAYEPEGCNRLRPSQVVYTALRRALRHTRPVVDNERVEGLWRCTTSRAKAHEAHRRARVWRGWRKRGPQVFAIKFNRLPAYDRAWAVSTSSCEAGMNPSTNTGNGFYGAFQFMLSTWQSAGGTGNPVQHSWHYQAVIAVAWMHVAGAGQWPVCGV